MTSISQGGYVILAWFRPHEDQADVFASRMRDAAARVRASGRARQFEFHRAADAGTEFLLYEEFASPAEWQAHHDSTEMQELRPAIAPMIDQSERSVWIQEAGMVNKDAPPGHTTLVKFRMAPESVAPMLAEMEHDVAAAGGMLRFDLNRGEQDPGAFFICARWADRESWQAHQSRPDYVAFRARTAHFYATPPDRTLWRPLRAEC